MNIQFLWWDGCPSHDEAWQRLQHVLKTLQVDAEVEHIQVKTEAEAGRWRFPGSPTIFVNGQDIDPRAAPPYRLTCRLYFREDGRPSPLPSDEMITRAIRRAQHEFD
ncbi:MAG: hypothetical protein JW966_13420 [Anaerolineae bacterium]|nr:hypothetical protein [Anaerolineae bacterium]